MSSPFHTLGVGGMKAAVGGVRADGQPSGLARLLIAFAVIAALIAMVDQAAADGRFATHRSQQGASR